MDSPLGCDVRPVRVGRESGVCVAGDPSERPADCERFDPGEGGSVTQVGGKSDRRRMGKKRLKDGRRLLESIFGDGALGRGMRSLGYWKSTGPRKPLWRQK